MKAAELLRLYEAGRRDFRGESLRGQSFKGKDLSGANFSGADIRSANFTNVNLTGAVFKDAEAGLQRRWIFFLIVCLLFLTLTAGVLIVFSSAFSVMVFDSSSTSSWAQHGAGWATLAIVLLFCSILIRQGIVQVAITMTVTAVAALAIAVTTVVILEIANVGNDFVGILPSTAGALAVVGYLVLALTVSLALAVALARVMSLMLARIIIGLVTLSLSGVITTIIFLTIKGAISIATTLGMAMVVVVSLVLVFLGAHIGSRAFQGDSRDAWIHTVVVALSAIGGTSFQGATLTDANFSAAQLKNADFRRAVLLRTRWCNANNLNCVRPGETYLSNRSIQRLLQTGDGQGKPYCHLSNLVGLNLQGANLVKADFTGSTLKDGNLRGAELANATFTNANLNGVNLQDADLTNANLVQAQLDGADLTGATLTGAYLEDWNITTATKLHGIRCDYVFMRFPPSGDSDHNPHRKPDDWDKTFTDGEFSDFIAPLVETLDLYHNQSVDPRAVAIAFHELREQNPEAELNIVSMEKRGKRRDKLLLRAEASPQTDLSKLSSQYFERYDHLLTLPPEALQALLIEKDKQVKMLVRMVDTAIERPLQTFINQYHNQGDVTVSGQGSNASRYDLRGAQFAGGFAETVKGDQIGGTINNQSAEKISLAEAAAEIQGLLKQLEQTAPAETMTEKMTLATQAIAQIEASPIFKQRTVAALTAGGIKAFEKAIDHPVAAFVVGAIEEWKKS